MSEERFGNTGWRRCAAGFALLLAAGGCTANREARRWASDVVGAGADPAQQEDAMRARQGAGGAAGGGPGSLVVTNYLQGGRSWHGVVRGLDGGATPAASAGEALSSAIRVPPPETASPPPMNSGTVPTPGAVSTSPGVRYPIEPGAHRLVVGIEMVEPEPGGVDHDLLGACAIDFTALPGAVYHLRTSWGRDAFTGDSLGPLDWSAWLVEDSTWNVVSDGSCVPVAN